MYIRARRGHARACARVPMSVRLLQLSVKAQIVQRETACCVTAVLLLVVAVACDAATALDMTLGNARVSASLRTSSIVTLLALASPVVVASAPRIPGLARLLADTQRPTLSALLLALALLGKHHGSESLRTADAAYCIVALLASLQIYKSGGIESEHVAPSRELIGPDSEHARHSVQSLASALMLYVGVRGARSAFVASDEALEYAQTPWSYTHTSASVSTPLALGHAALAATGLIVLTTDRVQGSSTFVSAAGLRTVGLVSTTAALWSLLAVSAHLDALPVLYDRDACVAMHQACAYADESRQFGLGNASTSGLWLAALSLFVLNAPFEATSRALQDWKLRVNVAASIAALVAVCAYALQRLGDGPTEVCVLAGTLGICISAVFDTKAGTLIYAVAHGFDELWTLAHADATRVLNHPTHALLLTLLSLLVVHLALHAAGLAEGRYGQASEASLTAATSLAFVLYVGSAVLLSVLNGQPLPNTQVDRGGSNERLVLAFAFNHFAPLFACASSHASCMLTPLARKRVWLATLPLTAVWYFCFLASASSGMPTASIVQPALAALLGVSGLVCWAAAAWIAPRR